MNSKYVYISALIILAILISGVSAANNNLIKNDFGNKAFTIDIPSDSNFNKEADSQINLGDLSMDMELFENKGDNSKDLSMILYLKDSSSNENIISEVMDDLKKDGDIVEENDNYVVVKNKNSKDFHLFDFNLSDIFNGVTNIIQSIFSQDNNVNVTTNDADVKVSNDGINIIDSNDTKVSLSSDGLKIVDSEGTVSISTKGLEVSDDKKGENVSISAEGLEVSDGKGGDNVSISAEGLEVSDKKGENVSISKEGLKVSSNGSNKGDSVDGHISINEDMLSNIDDADYSICIKNQKNNQLIVLVGNNLDLMKSMADTASFTEN